MRMYIFCFKKNTRKKSFHQQIYSYEFTFFSLQKIKDRRLFVFQQRKVLLQQFFKCKRYLKNSIKLIKIIFFCGHLGEDFFRHPHFRKQEYYFFGLVFIKKFYLFLRVLSHCRNTLKRNTECRHAFLYKIFRHSKENSNVNCELFSKTDFSGDCLIF